MKEESRETVVEQMVRSIARRVLRGEEKPGNKLPPLRALAEEFGVTVATAQRAVAHLEALGLIATRQGSGMEVRNPIEHAGLSLLPMWLEAKLSEPEEATQMLANFLELRRLLAMEVLQRIRQQDDSLDTLLRQMEPLLQEMEEPGRSAQQAMTSELHLSRMLLQHQNQLAFVLLFNSVAQLLRQLPSLVEAMYADPATNAASYRMMFSLLQQEGTNEDIAPMMLSAMAALDQQTVERFRAHLETLI